MKKLTIILILCSTLGVLAQKVTVTRKSEKIRDASGEGYGVELEGKKDAVAASWGRFIKDLGKVKAGSDFQFIEGPAMGGTVYSTGVLYATSKGNEEKATVWMGILATEWKVNDITLVDTQIEKLVYQFGVKFYRDKIQAQIDEGQQALDAVVRQQQRLVGQNKDLNTKIRNNDEEKTRLEKAIESNKLEKLVFQQKLVNNVKAQDSVKLAGEQIKSVIERYKEKQRKVN